MEGASSFGAFFLDSVCYGFKAYYSFVSGIFITFFILGSAAFYISF